MSLPLGFRSQFGAGAQGLGGMTDVEKTITKACNSGAPGVVSGKLPINPCDAWAAGQQIKTCSQEPSLLTQYDAKDPRGRRSIAAMEELNAYLRKCDKELGRAGALLADAALGLKLPGTNIAAGGMYFDALTETARILDGLGLTSAADVVRNAVYIGAPAAVGQAAYQVYKENGVVGSAILGTGGVIIGQAALMSAASGGVAAVALMPIALTFGGALIGGWYAYKAIWGEGAQQREAEQARLATLTRMKAAMVRVAPENARVTDEETIASYYTMMAQEFCDKNPGACYYKNGKRWPTSEGLVADWIIAYRKFMADEQQKKVIVQAKTYELLLQRKRDAYIATHAKLFGGEVDTAAVGKFGVAAAVVAGVVVLALLASD